MRKQTDRLLTQKRFVDFINKRADHETAMLGALGFSTVFITSKTRLTPGQVGYRLKKASIRRADFRNGESPFARAMLRNARIEAEPRLVRHLRRAGVIYAHAG